MKANTLHLLASFYCLLCPFYVFSQVGINNTDPNAMLEITATNAMSPSITDGVLIPRINTFPTTNPGTAQNGMLVFLTTAVGANPSGFYYWDNTSVSWVAVTGTFVLEDVDGDTKVQVEESTDEDIIRFDTDGSERMVILNNGNVGVGESVPNYPLEVAGNARFNNNLFFGTSGARLSGNNQGGSLELGPENSSGGEIPFIDFHYGVGASEDYNFRIINDGDHQLSFQYNTFYPLRINSSGIQIGENYTLPYADGGIGQVLGTDGSGTISWTTLATPSTDEIVDADGDTKIQVEESADEDIIRFDTRGTEYFRMTTGRLGVYNTGESVFIGQDAGASDNLNNNENVYVGYRAGRDNSTFYNVAIGAEALAFGSSSDRNVAIGHSAAEDLTGTTNVAVGGWAMASAEAVDYTVAIGANAFRYAVSGSEENVIIGDGAYEGSSSNFPSNANQVVSIGARSCEICMNKTNGIAIGYDTDVTASNQARIGNSSITSIGGYANWTNVSDARFKINVKADIVGLDFILKLRPVSYNLDLNALAKFNNTHNDARNRESEALKEAEVQTGFIAQEVEKAAQDLGFNFHGIDVPKNSASHYGLRYAEFVVPLVKAVQEQQALIEFQNTTIQNLEEELVKQQDQYNNLLERIKKLENVLR